MLLIVQGSTPAKTAVIYVWVKSVSSIQVMKELKLFRVVYFEPMPVGIFKVNLFYAINAQSDTFLLTCPVFEVDLFGVQLFYKFIN
ncbi:hypothetical protein D3C72_2168260 [compost metagenome]